MILATAFLIYWLAASFDCAVTLGQHLHSIQPPEAPLWGTRDGLAITIAKPPTSRSLRGLVFPVTP